MADQRSLNCSMFWRIERRLLSANRGRVFVILLALGAGAAVTAALLNLQVDAKHRLTADFRSFGANVLVAPQDSASSSMNESPFDRIPDADSAGAVAKAEFLYGVVEISSVREENAGQNRLHTRAILAGYAHSAAQPARVLSPVLLAAEQITSPLNSSHCGVGEKLASVLSLHTNDRVRLESASRQVACTVSVLPSSGGPEDNQIFLQLPAAQTLLDQPGRISLIQLSAPGTPQQIQNYLAELQQRLPGVDVRPIRQFTEGEAKIYSRISGVLTATVAVILILTGLCVMAAMTNIAMERKNDVALMKAIGGAARRVLRFFLMEATLLGFVGGLIGAAFGLLLSVWLGRAVFGVAAQPRFIVYPVSVALTVLVAILGAFPLRRLVEIRPAVIFRGGE